MKKRFLPFIILLAALAPYAYGGSLDLVTFTFEDHSLFPGNLQIRDEICKTYKTTICDDATTALRSSECRLDPSLEKCVQAKGDVLDACPCKEAIFKLTSPECQQTPPVYACYEAKKMQNSANCIPGLIIETPAGKGVKLNISACKSAGGFGNVSIRDSSKTSEWTNYPLISDKNTITYP